MPHKIAVNCLVIILVSVTVVHCQSIPADPLPKYGRTITINANGYFVPVVPPDVAWSEFIEILARAGIKGDDAIKAEGKAALDTLSSRFSITTGFVTDDNLLHDPPKVDNGQWEFETGVMDQLTNIQVLSETISTEDGTVKGRMPTKPVRLSFAYWRLTCIVDACPIAGSQTVPKGTRVIVQRLVAQEEDFENGWGISFKATSRDPFYTYVQSDEQMIVKGILNDDVTDDTYGAGQLNGLMEINQGKMKDMGGGVMAPGIKLNYIVTFDTIRPNSEKPDWKNNEKVDDDYIPCGHLSCLPGIDATNTRPEGEPIAQYGVTISVHAKGHFVPVMDKDVYFDILKRADIKNKDAAVAAGKAGMTYIQNAFGIDTSFVENENLEYLVPIKNNSDESWQFDIGVMGEATNIHVLDMTKRYEDGKTKILVPDDPVRLSFAYLRITCIKESCTIKDNNNVPQSTRAIVQWLATSKEKADKDWDIAFQAKSRSMFQTYKQISPPTAIKGIITDVVESPFGTGELNGIMMLDMFNGKTLNLPDGTNMTLPSIEIYYVATFDDLLPEEPEDSGCSIPTATLPALFLTISYTLILTALEY